MFLDYMRLNSHFKCISLRQFYSIVVGKLDTWGIQPQEMFRKNTAVEKAISPIIAHACLLERSSTVLTMSNQTSCARGDTLCPRPSPCPRGRPSACASPSRRNVAVLSHAEYVPTLTAAAALRVKAALSKAACNLDL